MSISFPPGLGFTVKRTPRVPAQPINHSRASTESQSLPSDYFESNSQSSVKKLINIGEDFWEQMENQGKASVSSERSVELNLETKEHFLDTLENPGETPDYSERSVELDFDTEGHFLDRLENPGETPDASEHNVELNFDTEGVSLSDLLEDLGEALSPVGVDTLLQTRQSANQAPTTQNPFHHTPPALPTTSPLPTEQQEITDPNGQQASKKTKRTSRHTKYQPALSSPQTDDEFESSDNEVSKKAKNRLRNRKLQQLKADSLGIPLTELVRQQREAVANKRGFKTTAELRSHEVQVAAKKRNLSVADYQRKRRLALANKRDFKTTAELERHYRRERAALKKAQKAQLKSQNR